MAQENARTLAQRRDRKRRKKRAQATDIEWWLAECLPKKRLARKKKKKKPQKPRNSWRQERATSADHPIETSRPSFADQDDSRRDETRQGRRSSPTPEFVEAVVLPSDGPSSTGSRQEVDVDGSPSEELCVIVHQSTVDNGYGHHELTTWQAQRTSGRSRRRAVVTQVSAQMICPVVVPCPFTGVYYVSYQTVRTQMAHAQFAR